ncbi:MAG: anthranilate synthase component I, partial [Candidatus Latescibacteria bacterium]|nr:anthranilate synthase component I [Candidatus Latescibacterota bacterium]
MIEIEYQPTYSEFCQIVEDSESNLAPIWCELPIDDRTPEAVYLNISEDRPYAFLLESLEGDEKTARYSFVGTDPVERLIGTDTGLDRIRGKQRETFTGDPVLLMREAMSRYKMHVTPGLPRFSGGAVGYFAYDIVRHFEVIPDNNPDEMNLPDLHFIIAGSVVVFDHLQGKLYVIANANTDSNDHAAEYDTARLQIDGILERLKSAGGASGSTVDPLPQKAGTEIPLDPASNVLPEAYQSVVRQAKNYIAAGDVFQVVLSQRFSTESPSDPFEIYRKLKLLNPSPYLFYLQLDDVQIVGASPETMVLVEDGQALVRPIAGTRRRGSTEDEDRALMKDLIEDPKECAEHVMLVDLGRNDLGRVCEYGTVQTTELMAIEKYSHVIHIVSKVDGRLRPGIDGFDVLRATFPAGTLSGAPKIRAMEIIDELETTRRGVYGGALGYVGFSGNMDLCITIRTLVVKNGRAYIQAGAG